MTTVVHAELVAGRRELLLFTSGDEHAMRRIARGVALCTPRFGPTEPRGGLSCRLSWAAVVQLATQLGQLPGVSWRPGPRLLGWLGEQVLARTDPAQLTYTPPDGLTPYPWQVSGAQMIAAVGSALITDEPGTGKTATAILGICELRARTGDTSPVIVICPASVIDPWVAAWSDWAPHLLAVALRGAPAQRAALLGAADVYVASYDIARIDSAALGKLSPQYVVIDECHLIKSPTALRTVAVRRLGAKARHVIAMSGTPITHHPGDLWPALSAISPAAYPSRERWVRRYCTSVQEDYREEILGLDPANEPEFRATLQGQMRRVAKADVLAQLPPKIYTVRTVELPAEWRRTYDDLEQRMLAELPDGTELSVMSVLSQMTRLAQLASAAADVTQTTEVVSHLVMGGIERAHVSVRLKAPSWKVAELVEILAERPGQQTVVFAPSRQLIELAGTAATAAGYRCGYITGAVLGAARTRTVDSFQRGDLDVICATTGAGGVGLTLTAASTVVFLQRPWSLVEATQAEDRCHRIGSERHSSIEVIDVVARGTIDTRVRAVLRERAGQLSDLVKDPRIATQLLGGASAADRKTA